MKYLINNVRMPAGTHKEKWSYSPEALGIEHSIHLAANFKILMLVLEVLALLYPSQFKRAFKVAEFIFDRKVGQLDLSKIEELINTPQ